MQPSGNGSAFRTRPSAHSNGTGTDTGAATGSGPPRDEAAAGSRRRHRHSSGRHPGPTPPPWPSLNRHGLSSTTQSSSSSDATSWPPNATLTSHYRALYHRHHQPQQLTRHSRTRKQPAKRHLPRHDETAMEQAHAKKPRTLASPPRHFEMPPSAAIPSSSKLQPSRDGPFSPSPLFFSHTPSRPLNRPTHSAPSDLTAGMLARSRDDAAGITTVKLPRASVCSSPAMTGSSLSSSLDLSLSTLSPDGRNLPASLQRVQNIGAIELIEHDERPTLLVDLSAPPDVNQPGLNILYYNGALRSCPDLCALLAIDCPNTASQGFDRFKAWAYHIHNSDSSGPFLPYHHYAGTDWTATTLRQRFRFISTKITALASRPCLSRSSSVGSNLSAVAESPLGRSMPVTPEGDNSDPPDYLGDAAPDILPHAHPPTLSDIATETNLSDGRRHPDEFTNQVLQLQPTKSVFDWTRIPITDSMPEHIRFAKSVDWASTPLGPMSEWTSDLRAMSNLIMGSPHPAAMYWGPELICIYNAAYIELAGQKHPSLMGMAYKDGWAEIWEEIKPIFKSAKECGQATMKHDNRLFINRNSFLEETFFSWAIVPLVGFEGEVVGLYNPAFEHTLRRINDRRMLTLREIGERTAAATTVGGFWPQVQKGLEYNEHDVPFSLIYSIKEDAESEVSSLQSGSFMHSPQIVLEGSPCVPEGHAAAPPFLDLRTSDEGFAPYMRQCIQDGGEPLVLSASDGSLPKDLIEGIEWGGFGDACTTIVIFPVVPTTKEAATGFVVLGLNPRRPYDDNYKLFIHLLSRQLATSMASVVLFEEEIRRGQRAARLAALDRQELSMQLSLRTQEASESEFRFTRMAEFAPVGMFIADCHGRINYCNDMWWQISRHSRFDETELAWMSSVRGEDRPALEEAWRKLLRDRVTVSVEFRFNHSQQRGVNTIDTWVLMSAFPEKNGDGVLKSIFGCITDISSQKWAEKVQSERREEAVELKRQQENFIDITSHEMRNPLSAVLQCADQISNNIVSFSLHKDEGQLETFLEGCLDAANTINLCASHQKRIVDDILTLSKLDSHLLAVTPVDEQPVKAVQRALKMFESELQAHDIELEFIVDDSFERHGVEWAKLDPSRLRQVLINLMTNAIKFTQGRDKRKIVVSLSASKDVSEVTSKGVLYFPRNDGHRTSGMDIENEGDWGAGERINLHCSVEDTGPGLAEEELKVLFQRFQQATPRTHVKYGGSGLGLFISRILTEMQGGQIGVTSVRGVGSKFNFYIQSRKCLNPPAGYERISPFRIGRKTQALPPAAALSGIPAAACSKDGQPLFDVLIVEDNIVNQKVLQRQLRSWGNNTFVANHGREALQTLEKSRFWAGQEAEGVDISVILMDLEMPVMDGMTCARRIRELEREGTIVKHIPIIAVTAYARPEQIEDAKAAGIDDVISKPFRIPDLMPKIEELVGRWRDLAVPAGA
ncbi:hypothetical protein XA68_16967 [Ophiocordyceps unilateralis]|uniref:Histidine kinase n=1 Tax=Ophiocordyceps unilateralis TaxID=268505 RepID=A0A2A9P5A5_OPHUN|nr:hypothetical protein XA68_16967 [Ophiocordyceps unilateralis]